MTTTSHSRYQKQATDYYTWNSPNCTFEFWNWYDSKMVLNQGHQMELVLMKDSIFDGKNWVVFNFGNFVLWHPVCMNVSKLLLFANLPRKNK